MSIKDILNLIYQGKYEEADRYIEKLDYSEKMERLLLKSRIFILREEYEKALSLTSEIISQSESTEARIQELGALALKSYALYRLGRIDEALILVDNCETILKNMKEEGKIEGKEWEPLVIEVNARLYWVNGDMNEALSYSQKALKVSEELGNNFQTARSLSLVGLMYRCKGLLDQSIDYLKRSLLIAEKLGYIYLISYSLHVLGVTYFYKGDFHHALRCFKRSLTIDEEDEKFDQISCSLLHIILTNLEMHSRNQAQNYLYQLEKLNGKTESKNMYIDLRTRLAEALVLKNSPRLKQKADAQRILEKIVDEEIILHDLTIYAMVHLCELLLDEIKMYGENDVIKEAEELSTRIYKIAQNQKSFSLVVESLLLLSRFALIRGEIAKANTLLEEANVIATKRNLTKFAEKVLNDQTSLKDELLKSEEIIKKGASIHERLAQARLNEYIDRMKDIVRTHG